MKKSLLYILCMTVIASCNKFLDVKPKGVVLPEKLGDFEGVLNSYPMTRTFQAPLLYCTDDYYGKYNDLDQSIQANAYYWRPNLDLDDQSSPAIWGPLYRTVYNANVIIRNVMDAVDGSAQQKQRILGEALLVRAEARFSLLTAFAKAYDPATAGEDPGIPLVTTTDVTEKTPPRATLQASLDTIVNDLKQAASFLPDRNVNRYRGTTYAAYGLLARIYLYMGNFSQAGLYTDMALEAPYQLLDYNNYESSFDFPDSDQNPEILWQRACDDYQVPTFMLYSEDLKTYFNDDDLRYELLTTINSQGLNRVAPTGRANFGITFPELYLNKAEVAARNNEVDTAMSLLNRLRKMRIKTAAYQPLSAASQEDAIMEVLAERRREMAFSGQRWMDMKRLDREGRMQEIKRINPVTGEVITSLAPHSKGYTFQIPVRVRRFNPDMQINE